MKLSHSTGWEEPEQVAPLFLNDLSGRGTYQFGLQKKPTGVAPDNSTKFGYQESNIDEGMIFGGLYIMDNTDRGCVFKGVYDPCCYNVGELDGVHMDMFKE
jgi:hypothetical protein